MCRVLEVSISGYYCWRSRAMSQRAKQNQRLLGKIQSIHKQGRQNLGSPKIYRLLRQQGETCNHKRVERLMREEGVKSKRVKKFRTTTDSRHKLEVSDNLLGRAFKVSYPDCVWVSDITYVWRLEGWLYLAVFIDLYSRKVVGWSMSERITTELVIAAFEMGQERRAERVSPMIHSDRGSQYASTAFRQKLTQHNCLQSMSRRGNCWDNAVAESFFSALKVELVHNER